MGEGEVNGDPVRPEQFGSPASQLDFRPAVGEATDPDLAPAHGPCSGEHLQRLVDSLLGRQPRRERGGRVAERLDILSLEIGKGPIKNPPAVASQQGPRPRQLDHVETYGVYGHGNDQNARLTGANHAGAGN